MSTQKTIFYFEDEPLTLGDFISDLRSTYIVEVGVSQALIEQPRNLPVDLVIVDLMIHHSDSSEEMGKGNLSFPGIPWQIVGIEFIKRLRVGEYKSYGLPPETPVIVASAVVSYSVKQEAERLGIKQYLEKPFTLDELESAVDKALQTSKRSK